MHFRKTLRMLPLRSPQPLAQYMQVIAGLASDFVASLPGFEDNWILMCFPLIRLHHPATPPVCKLLARARLHED